MSKELTPVKQEVLPASLTKGETDRIEGKAVKLYQTMEKTSILFAMELRRLQEGGAHLVRGYPNFGAYIEATFEGISAVNAGQISRVGKVLLVLESVGELDEKNPIIGATGARALAKIYKDLGEDAMVQIYKRAAYFMLQQHRHKVTDDLVLAATRELIAPTIHELGEGSEESTEEDEEDEREVSEELESLLETIVDCTHEIRTAYLEGKDAMTYLQELNEYSEKLNNYVKKGND